MKPSRIVPAALAALVPVSAHAQEIPVSLVLAALSPLLVIGFAIALGFLARSFRIGLLHTSLVLLWVVLFVIASRTTTNDYVIWAPILVYAVHALLILILMAARIVRRPGASHAECGE